MIKLKRYGGFGCQTSYVKMFWDKHFPNKQEIILTRDVLGAYIDYVCEDICGPIGDILIHLIECYNIDESAPTGEYYYFDEGAMNGMGTEYYQLTQEEKKTFFFLKLEQLNFWELN